MAVSIQQAGVNALATYLRSKLPGVRVEDRWPDPDNHFKHPTITILCAGPREDTPLNLRQLNFTNVGVNRVQTQWFIAACEQRLQMDVWCTDAITRDSLLAQLDDALNYEPGNDAGHGLYLSIADGWVHSFADYYFDSPTLIDEQYLSNVYEFRAKLTGHLFVNLTVTRETARQVQIQFKQRLSETDPSSVPYDTKTI